MAQEAGAQGRNFPPPPESPRPHGEARLQGGTNMKRWIPVATIAAVRSGAWAHDLPVCMPFKTGAGEQQCSCESGLHQGEV